MSKTLRLTISAMTFAGLALVWFFEAALFP